MKLNIVEVKFIRNRILWSRFYKLQFCKGIGKFFNSNFDWVDFCQHCFFIIDYEAKENGLCKSFSQWKNTFCWWQCRFMERAHSVE